LVVKQEIDLFGFDLNIKRDWWWSIILSNYRIKAIKYNSFEVIKMFVETGLKTFKAANGEFR